MTILLPFLVMAALQGQPDLPFPAIVDADPTSLFQVDWVCQLVDSRGRSHSVAGQFRIQDQADSSHAARFAQAVIIDDGGLGLKGNFEGRLTATLPQTLAFTAKNPGRSPLGVTYIFTHSPDGFRNLRPLSMIVVDQRQPAIDADEVVGIGFCAHPNAAKDKAQ